MKRIIIAFGLLVVLAVCSCQIKEEIEDVPDAKVFTAIIEDDTNVEIKTSMDANCNVLWKQGDQVSIFAGSTINEQYQVSDASDGKTSATLNRVTAPGFVAGGEIDNNVAFYPYAVATSIAKSGEGYIISDIVLPSVQNYAEDSFGNGSFPMAAVTTSTDDMNLKFKNVLSGLKLQLKGTATITSISITGNNNEILCGAVEVTASNTAKPTISLTDATAKTVTLDCGNGVELNTETATLFIIALPPMTMTGGFTVTVTDTEGKQMEIKTTKPQTFNRSKLLKMPALAYEGTSPAFEPQYVDLGLPSGLKWATCNVGATAPEEYGDYFAWGEVEPYYSSQDPLTWKEGKTGYNWTSYKFRTSGDSEDNIKFSKYNIESFYGVVDNKTVLDLEDDAASVQLGGNRRIPTNEEWKELIDTCTWTWTSQNGVNGQLVTGSNGNSIFLPAANYVNDTYLDNASSCGMYWSISLDSEYPFNAWGVYLSSGDIVRARFCRNWGHTIRPVEGARVSVTNVKLSNSHLDLAKGNTAYLTAAITPLYATQTAIQWTSNNTAVATVSADGEVTAVGSGTATITATTYDGGFTATCTVTVIVPEAVDLGLSSGLKWASCNLGAIAPEASGDYYAWGEIEPHYEAGYEQSESPVWTHDKTGYNWSSYQWCHNSYSSLNKYCTDGWYGSWGFADNKTILEAEDDIAYMVFGGNWRMPTDAEWTELKEQCTWTHTTINATYGLLITGPNGNSIFLPAAGIWNNTNLQEKGSLGSYWSSSIKIDYPYSSRCVTFDGYSFERGWSPRYTGQTVRPVSDEGVRISVEGVSLNLNSVILTENQSGALSATVMPSNATQPAVIWSSSNTSVVTIDYITADYGCVLFAGSEGTATITATTYDGNYSAICQVTVIADIGTGSVNEWVDLELPSGLKWATCNLCVGGFVSSPEEYGDYYAWGETEPYYSSQNPLVWKENKLAGYDWSSYGMCGGVYNTLTKYNTNGEYGIVDNKVLLETDDDVAQVNLGGSWRIPTDDDWTELSANCTVTWTKQRGVFGLLCVGHNGNSIFLPAAGNWDFAPYLSGAGVNGLYWSSMINVDSPSGAWSFGFGSEGFHTICVGRNFGCSIRPVTE